MKTEILSTHNAALFDAAVARAADLLRAGEVVALPTETVYGLVARAEDPDAVRRVFEVKGRPAHNPVIVHVEGKAMARAHSTGWTPVCEALADAFWPGPLTLVLPRGATIPDVVTAGGGTVGIRWPSHPLFRAVLRSCGFPLAAPSANLANRVSPTNAEHVRQGLEGLIPLIVDGGQAQVGIESTVVDAGVQPPRVLRPGMIPARALVAAVGGPVVLPGEQGESGPLKSPGQLPRHYAPRARLEVWDWSGEAELLSRLRRLSCSLDEVRILAHTHVPLGLPPHQVAVIPHDAEAFARALYAELHACDASGARCVIVEKPPPGPDWEGITDRLRRASTTGPGFDSAH